MSIAEIAPASIDTASTVAANIRAESARRGYSQSELGRALGITQSQVNRRWRGVIPWQLDELDAVAYLLGVSVIELVTPPRGGLGYEKLPRLDSNQQPADYFFSLLGMWLRRLFVY
ncbi:helix-turn-helix domain-containing protein [Mobiluncus curtisii]|uniref:helix-turn-helix domain-containing protein n=2 Tax=Mobiluncus curtisii TaxID=2051 RepID=UPI00191AD857|nr:helix-turn-helix transcriptional regulator [Mobiluncus curtisii]QQU08589.1 helix-turn-helix transcriptional regulator [Mobiluncus curtisii]